MIETRISVLKDELESLKRKESISCSVKIVDCKVADADGDMHDLVGCLRRYTFDTYACIRHGDDRLLFLW